MSSQGPGPAGPVVSLSEWNLVRGCTLGEDTVSAETEATRTLASATEPPLLAVSLGRCLLSWHVLGERKSRQGCLQVSSFK